MKGYTLNAWGDDDFRVQHILFTLDYSPLSRGLFLQACVSRGVTFFLVIKVIKEQLAIRVHQMGRVESKEVLYTL